MYTIYIRINSFFFPENGKNRIQTLCTYFERITEKVYGFIMFAYVLRSLSIKEEKMAAHGSRSWCFSFSLLIKSFQSSAIIHGMKVKILINYGRKASKNIRVV